jgi:hypothetical protein
MANMGSITAHICAFGMWDDIPAYRMRSSGYNANNGLY